MTMQPLPVEGIPRAPQSISRDAAWLHAAAGSCILFWRHQLHTFN